MAQEFCMRLVWVHHAGLIWVHCMIAKSSSLDRMGTWHESFARVLWDHHAGLQGNIEGGLELKFKVPISQMTYFTAQTLISAHLKKTKHSDNGRRVDVAPLRAGTEDLLAA